MPEREEHRFLAGIIVAIADIDPLAVLGLLAACFVEPRGGYICVAQRVTFGQFAAGVCYPGQ